MKFCTQCRHLTDTYDCARPGPEEINRVSGKPLVRVPTDAWHERYTENDNTCGKEAKFFDGQ